MITKYNEYVNFSEEPKLNFENNNILENNYQSIIRGLSKLTKIIHHLDLFHHKHHHDLPKDMSLNHIKKEVGMIDVKSKYKKLAIKAINENNIDDLLKYLKLLKYDLGMKK
jgi:hypothetical protein